MPPTPNWAHTRLGRALRPASDSVSPPEAWPRPPLDNPGQAWALNSRGAGPSLPGPWGSLLKARARPPDPFPFWAAWSSTATAACRPPGGQQGLPPRPPHSSSPAPSIPGSDCSSAPGRFRAVVPGSGVPPGPLPVRPSRVPPCDVRKACSQRSGRGSSLPPCPRARERSALSRGAPGAPAFPFPNWAQPRGSARAGRPEPRKRGPPAANRRQGPWRAH